jgi:ATP-dependent RNA helicase DDX23/PRP28
MNLNNITGKRGRDEFEMQLSPEEEMEARKYMELAAIAEAKAAQRALNKSDGTPKNSEQLEGVNINSTSFLNSDKISKNNSDNIDKKAKFLTKAEREALALERLQQNRNDLEQRNKEALRAHERFVTGQALEEKRREARIQREKEDEERRRRQKEESKEAGEHDHELKAIRDHYLGIREKKKRILKPSEKFARIFQFDWEEKDDTARNDMNPLYNHKLDINALYGRGYIGGVDLREQRKKSNFLNSLSNKRLTELMTSDKNDSNMTSEERRDRERTRELAAAALKRRQEEELIALDSTKLVKMGMHWSEKKLDEMTERDWRIFREDFDIRVQAGRATLPLRYWEEAGFPTEILNAIKAVGYEKPSPIQRQAIPMGLAQRDIIGIAETGSGKTAAFAIPLLCYLLQLPPEMIDRVEDDGPLAVVMAPTRELAMQIEEEFIKLAKYTPFRTICVVGGQSIEDQGFKLRKGVEVVIGTPGRMVDCLQSNYMVLNQCNYVVLDEADRMIDMGFEPQVIINYLLNQYLLLLLIGMLKKIGSRSVRCYGRVIEVRR